MPGEGRQVKEEIKKTRGECKDTEKLDKERRRVKVGDEKEEEGDVVIGDPALGLWSTLH